MVFFFCLQDFDNIRVEIIRLKIMFLRVLLILIIVWSIEAQDELSLAMSGAFQPFSTTDSQGNLTGLDADVARELARAMNKKAQLVQIDWSGIQAGLQSQKYDLICGSMAITKERLETMNFSLPYYVSGAQVFTKEGIENLENLRVGVTEDSTYAHWIEENPRHFPNAKILVFGSEAEIVVAMESGKVDAFVSDRIVGGFYASKAKSLRIVPYGDLLYKEECGIAARKDDLELIRRVNLALLKIVQSGIYSQIYKKWVGIEPDLEELLGSWSRQVKNLPQEVSVRDKQEKKPDFISTGAQMMPLLIEGLGLTIFLAVITMVVSLALGIVLGVGGVSRNPLMRRFSGLYTYVVRGTPLLVQLFFSYFVVTSFFNELAGFEVLGAISAALLALIINTTAYHAETIRGGILSIPEGQWQAGFALGMSRVQVLKTVILPQALRSSIPSLTNNCVVLIKDTSLVGAITLVELTYAARSIVFQTGQAVLPFLLAAALYLALISVVIWVSNKVEGQS